jgi:hypothetical protein
MCSVLIGVPVKLERSGKELILATKTYAFDCPRKSWWCVLSTTRFLAIAIVGLVGRALILTQVVPVFIWGTVVPYLFYAQTTEVMLVKQNKLIGTFGVLLASKATLDDHFRDAYSDAS